HRHHIECIMDGIIKTRCFLEKDMTFKAKDEDYKVLKNVWLSVIKSWMDVSQAKNVELNERIFYLPENCQYLYWRVCEQKRKLTRDEVKEIALKAMSVSEYYEAWNILSRMELLIESNGLIRPHYISEIKDG
ncbi:hypothetical protein LCGC14_2214780, partial [marine sediment metagenome]